MQLYREYLETFFGKLCLVANEEFLLSVTLEESGKTKLNSITTKTKEWLLHYFQKEPPSWLPPLAPPRTPFETKVRKVVLKIPFGICKSYKEIAVAIGQPKAYRAVAQAMKRNPFMIIVPCHRVIGSKGLGGYNGGLKIKKQLLEFEGCESINF